ncbi:MAG: sugar ABC transporter ATP-binding protein, partial [Phycisphaerae bacterium]|nr:sugar ABC transporter ATP-binding protein [Phycisphaerae bacterium]
MAEEALVIEFRNITRTFGGVRALTDVSLSIRRGECHALMGENGAGKSTLGKVLAGILRPDSGVVSIDGVPRQFRSPRDAAAAGVGMVHQELAFCPELSVAENLVMGRYPRRGPILDRRAMRRQARDMLARIGAETIDVNLPIGRLSTAQEQLVQIASAVGSGARILVFDEPTSSLAEPEAQRLFSLIDQLKSDGRTIVYVSHRMPEIFRLCDRISVLRDGRHVGTITRAEATHDSLVRMMVGRSVEVIEPRHVDRAPGPVALSVNQLTRRGVFEDISFEIRRGQIVGLAGLVGAGRSEVARAIFGLDRYDTGQVILDGQRLPPGDIHTAMARGVCLVPEDRKRQGLVLIMGARQNLSLTLLDRLRRLLWLDTRQLETITGEFFQRLAIKASSFETPVMAMSGGNQQKVVLAKWLARDPKLLIVDEPTRGVDVSAKRAIHELLDELA